MKKPLILISLLIVAAGLLWAGHFYWQNLRGAGPAFKPPPEEIAKLLPAVPPPSPGPPQPIDDPTGVLKLPPGFAISIFAKVWARPGSCAWTRKARYW